MFTDIGACSEAYTTWGAEWRLAVAVVKTYPFLGQSVDISRSDCGVTVAAEIVGSQLIGSNDE